MDQAIEYANAHAGDDAIMEETGNGLNYQFRGASTDANGNLVQRIGRVQWAFARLMLPRDSGDASDGRSVTAHSALKRRCLRKKVGAERVGFEPAKERRPLTRNWGPCNC